MKRIILLYWLGIISLSGIAQTMHILPSSSHGAGIQTPCTDTWTAFHNPASLVQDSVMQVALQYENRYFLPSLHTALAQVGIGTRWVNIGVGFSFYGYSRYQEMLTAITLSRSLGPASIGVGAVYAVVYGGIERGYRGTVVPQLGATYTPCPEFTIGVHLFNPFLQRIPLEQDVYHTLPAIYSLGTDYRFAPHFRWMVQGEWRGSSSWRVATAFEWEPIASLVVKAGVYYQNSLVGAIGIAWAPDRFRMDVNVDMDPRLGIIPQIRLAYCFPCAR